MPASRARGRVRPMVFDSLTSPAHPILVMTDDTVDHAHS